MAALDPPQGLSPAARRSPKIKAKGEKIYRHRLVVRLCHWINAWCLLVLLMSGLQIFNAHSELYWGKQGTEINPTVIAIHAGRVRATGARVGFVKVLGGKPILTTGFLGLSTSHGHLANRAWPNWMTLPSGQDLSSGRRWHFFFAWLFVLNGLAYVAWSLFSKHLGRDLIPTLAQLRQIGRSIIDHILLKHPTGEEAKSYNVLQRLAYLAVMFGLLPLMVLTGMTMSPGLDAGVPGLLWVFGGRQSARTLHFIFAWSIVLFFIVHMVEMVLAGPINEVRSILTGWFVVPPDKGHKHD
jgi:thiosulfate reductase cytochrome b subunit